MCAVCVSRSFRNYRYYLPLQMKQLPQGEAQPLSPRLSQNLNSGTPAAWSTSSPASQVLGSQSSSPSSPQPHSSHCRAKASSLCHHASLPWGKRNHVGPAKATSPSLRLRRWRPFLRLPSLGLHSVVSVVNLPSLLPVTRAVSFVCVFVFS